MRRRALLASLGVVGAGCVTAGCLGGPTTDDGSSAPVTTTRDGPSDCPDLDDDRPTVCAGDDDRLGLSGPTVVEPDADVSFELRNETNGRFVTSFYGNRLRKHVDDEWYLVGPWLVPEPLHGLAPGESHGWSGRFSTSTADVEHSPREIERARFSGVGGGRYVRTGTGGFEADGLVRVAWPFEFDAPAVSAEPTDLSTRREGSRLLVAGDGRGEDEFVLRRTPDRTADRSLIPERVVRFRSLRETLLWFEEGVDEVLLVNDGAWDYGGLPTKGGSVLEYDGGTFAVSIEDVVEAF